MSFSKNILHKFSVAFLCSALLLVAGIQTHQHWNKTQPAHAAMLSTINTSFQGTNGTVYASKKSADNKLYFIGDFTRVCTNRGHVIPVNTTTGAQAHTIVKTLDYVDVVISDGSGGWYVGGAFENVNNSGRSYFIHINSDGTLDLTFNPNTNSGPTTIVKDGSTLYIGGGFSMVDGQSRNSIAAVDATTGAVLSWYPTGGATGGSVSKIVLDATRVYAGGTFTNIGGSARNRLAALDKTTAAVSGTFNPNVNGTVHALHIANGLLYVGGEYTTISATARKSLAQIDLGTDLLTTWNPDLVPDPNFVNVYIYTITSNGSTIYFGGKFIKVNGAGGSVRNYAGAVDETTALATAWDPNISNGNYNIMGTNPEVTTMTIDGTNMYIGGNFTKIGTSDRYYIGTTNLTTGAVQTLAPQIGNRVRSIAVQGSIMMIGGLNHGVGCVTRNNAGAIDLTNGNPTAWDPNLDYIGNTIDIIGSTIYIGGQFTTVNGATTRNYLASFNNTTGTVTGWDPNADGQVTGIISDGTTLYARGAFSTIGGASRMNIGAVDTTTGLATAFNPDPDSEVKAMLVSGSKVYFGGQFTNVNTNSVPLTRNYLAAADKTTGVIDPTWIPDADWEILTMTKAGSTIYLGGNFSQLNVGTTPVNRNYAAAVNDTTGTALAWYPNPDFTVEFLTMGESDATVFAFGGFDIIGGVSRGGTAGLNASDALATSWNPGNFPGRFHFEIDGDNMYISGAAVSYQQHVVGGLGFLSAPFGAVCGNNLKETGETCDGTDLNSQTCLLQGFTGGGTLACYGSCNAFVTTSCTMLPVCGNNIKEAGETCDGTDLNGETCISQGFGGGSMTCNGSCTAFDTTSCTANQPVVVTGTGGGSGGGFSSEDPVTSPAPTPSTSSETHPSAPETSETTDTPDYDPNTYAQCSFQGKLFPIFHKKSLPFTDIRHHWAEDDINALRELGILNDIEGNNRFGPNQPLSRADFTRIILLVFCYDIDEPEHVTANPFPDVDKNLWFARYINTAAKHHIINGYFPLSTDGEYFMDDSIIKKKHKNGTIVALSPEEKQQVEKKITFRPLAPIQRAEAVKIFLNASKMDISSTFEPHFIDIAADAWYTPYIRFAAEKGYIEGYPDKSFHPLDIMTRGEMAHMIFQMKKQDNDNKKENVDIEIQEEGQHPAPIR